MNHMPYEDTGLSAPRDEEPQQEATPRDMPGRTPHSAEGPDKERRMPAGEPGKTPGSAEGEDPDDPPSRH